MKPGSQICESEAETIALAQEFGRNLRPGDTVLLEGPMGAGKTFWVQQACVALGVDPREVTSPTYTLVQTYPGEALVIHADLHRIPGPVAPEELGLSEWDLDPERVLFVEWPGAAPNLGDLSGYRVRIEVLGESRRRIEIMSLE